ncbi:bifunctional glutamate N-acetyltransferase/amino-acid acetyltransferase ArgJ [Iamia sp. SCSIO 61187]|uniref:bifunctional glutamate N-acetyltransferase/amino-acid acetyltransferase ArgJ n=1 Tax=Iamia sp. SCSIO 61187 TaxID=2722752 RepID=UPI001C62E032|nr:bifunctional glutamate N-acetyltransferase/amino-acid acetyltransferase ArgJ [Iamia sp. SCSIO 61187]QYG93053.1 bifunctional glutamate N-acetyltransferase/amino-acid acetyltransferase ArgJ [Iamia sp. SCSIO 61187]
MSVTAPAGFVAGGVACGIKESGDPDLALVATADGTAVAAAGVFTANLMTAAPVQVSRAHLAATGGRAAAVVLNSGNANAATGAPGRADSERTCAAVAAELGCAEDEVLVGSTGLIGIPLPVEPLVAGIPDVVAVLSGDAEGGAAAAEALRTTDTRRKEAVARAGAATVGGMAKGAAMLAPSMATMLAVLTTDAEAEPEVLHRVLAAGVAGSFDNLLTDGCTSTNDTVVLLASGRAGPVDEDALVAAVTSVCTSLAEQMADDAEGATKVVRLTVAGAVSDAEARTGAERIARSLLCKCSWYGRDPYWGRLASELGSAGIGFDQERVAVAYGGVTVAAGGVTIDHDAAAVAAHMDGRYLEITCDLGLGPGTATVLTNDLTHAYLDENMGTS